VETTEVIYRTRPQPSGGTILAGLIGLGLLFSTTTLIWGLVLIGLAVWSWRLAEVVITKRTLRAKLGMFSGTAELQLAKLETIRTGWGLGGRPMAVVGTGGTVYRLGTILNHEEFRSQLEAAMEANRRAG
jgi:hypothetical protein